MLLPLVHLFHLLSNCSTDKPSQSMKRTDTSQWFRPLPLFGPISMQLQTPSSSTGASPATCPRHRSSRPHPHLLSLGR